MSVQCASAYSSVQYSTVRSQLFSGMRLRSTSCAACRHERTVCISVPFSAVQYSKVQAGLRDAAPQHVVRRLPPLEARTVYSTV
eukprot:5251717-Pyramimonas_sp.AAC.1